jgi:hypothetical protein
LIWFGGRWTTLPPVPARFRRAEHCAHLAQPVALAETAEQKQLLSLFQVDAEFGKPQLQGQIALTKAIGEDKKYR